MWAVEPSNPSKVKVYGPGVEKGVKTNQQTYFTVDCKGAGAGKFDLCIKNLSDFVFIPSLHLVIVLSVKCYLFY
jgi:hypothetical protein